MVIDIPLVYEYTCWLADARYSERGETITNGLPQTNDHTISNMRSLSSSEERERHLSQEGVGVE